MFRKARDSERELLDTLTLAGLRHWKHDQNFPEVYANFTEMLKTETDPNNDLVFVLEGDEGIIGFFELRDHGADVELLRMFLREDVIGQGYGRTLWDEAVRTASISHRRMTIMSDPGSIDFYTAMGATLEGEHEVAPGFVLGAFTYDLGETAISTTD